MSDSDAVAKWIKRCREQQRLEQFEQHLVERVKAAEEAVLFGNKAQQKGTAMADTDNEPSAVVRVLKDDTFWWGTCISLVIIGVSVFAVFGVQGCQQKELANIKLEETKVLYKAVAQPVQDDALRQKLKVALEEDEKARKLK